MSWVTADLKVQDESLGILFKGKFFNRYNFGKILLFLNFQEKIENLEIWTLGIEKGLKFTIFIKIKKIKEKGSLH